MHDEKNRKGSCVSLPASSACKSFFCLTCLRWCATKREVENGVPHRRTKDGETLEAYAATAADSDSAAARERAASESARAMTSSATMSPDFVAPSIESM